MLAALFCLGVFSFWAITGYGVVTALDPTRYRLQAALLAPAVGYVLTILGVFLLSYAGVPVGPIAWPVTAVLLVIGIVLSRRFGRLPSKPALDVDHRFAWRDLAPYAVIALAAFLLTGRPILEFGFNWVSVCNDDMGNYCLSAERFARHGYFQVPTPAEVADGKDYSQIYFFMFVAGNSRPGSELILAWALSLFRQTAHQVFMPIIVAQHLCLVLCAAALAVTTAARRLAGIVAASAVAMSALMTLGAVYQLIAQVGGLAAAAATATLLLRPPGSVVRGWLFARFALLAGLATAGLAVIYPEVCPFVGLAWIVGLLLANARNPTAGRRMLLAGAAAALVVAVVLNRFTFGAMLWLLGQAGGSGEMQDPRFTLFPYYLIPTGPADLFGLHRLAAVASEPIRSISIVAGLLLLAISVAATLWMAWWGEVAGLVASIMLAMGFWLFDKNNGFGLFKLAMFAQPFLIPTLVLAWLRLSRERPILARRVPLVLAGLTFCGMLWALWLRGNPALALPLVTIASVVGSIGAVLASWYFAGRRWPVVAGIAPLATLALCGLPVQYRYATISRGVGSEFNEIPGSSQTGLVDELHGLMPKGPGVGIICDPYNLVVTKFQSLYTPGRNTLFLSNQFFSNIADFVALVGRNPTVSQAMDERSVRLRELYDNQYVKSTFDLHAAPGVGEQFDHFYTISFGTSGVPAGTSDEAMIAAANGHAPLWPPRTDLAGLFPGRTPYFVASGPRQSPLNRRPLAGVTANFVCRPIDQFENMLVFIASGLGQPYYTTGMNDLHAIFPLENEPLYFPTQTMAALGRYMLFEVVQPTGRPRLLMNLSATYKVDGKNQLPPAVAVGSGRTRVPFVGRGSARIFSPPLDPQGILGRQYLFVDLGIDGTRYPKDRSGLMNLYGRTVLADRRLITAYARDISLVSSDVYRGLQPPSRVSKFPDDLANPDLEYSGMYEDGWCAEDVFFRLKQPTQADGVTAAPARVVVKGEFPQRLNAGPRQTIMVTVDGVPVARQTIPADQPFDIEGDCPPPDAHPADPDAAGPRGLNRRVEVTFSNRGTLLAPDIRPASAGIWYVGLDPALPATQPTTATTQP